MNKETETSTITNNEATEEPEEVYDTIILLVYVATYIFIFCNFKDM